MARANLQITRRNFLKSGFWGAVGLSLSQCSFQPMVSEARRFGLDLPWFRRGKLSTTYNYCDMCPWRCGIVVRSVDNKVYKVDGNPADPKSRGLLCARGQGGPSFLYDPDRLQAPMLRTGERGEGKFKEVAWSEALGYGSRSAAKYPR